MTSSEQSWLRCEQEVENYLYHNQKKKEKKIPYKPQFFIH